jgi:hypothetical protein
VTSAPCQLLGASCHLCSRLSPASSSIPLCVGIRTGRPAWLAHSQVELLSWKSNKDLTGDGGIIKTTTREGEGWDHAKNKDEVVGEHRPGPVACGTGIMHRCCMWPDSTVHGQQAVQGLHQFCACWVCVLECFPHMRVPS